MTDVKSAGSSTGDASDPYEWPRKLRPDTFEHYEKRMKEHCSTYHLNETGHACRVCVSQFMYDLWSDAEAAGKMAAWNEAARMAERLCEQGGAASDIVFALGSRASANERLGPGTPYGVLRACIVRRLLNEAWSLVHSPWEWSSWNKTEIVEDFAERWIGQGLVRLVEWWNLLYPQQVEDVFELSDHVRYWLRDEAIRLIDQDNKTHGACQEVRAYWDKLATGWLPPPFKLHPLSQDRGIGAVKDNKETP